MSLLTTQLQMWLVPAVIAMVVQQGRTSLYRQARSDQYYTTRYGNNYGGPGTWDSRAGTGVASFAWDSQGCTRCGSSAARGPEYRGNGYDNLSPEWAYRMNKGAWAAKGDPGWRGGSWSGSIRPVDPGWGAEKPQGQGVSGWSQTHQGWNTGYGNSGGWGNRVPPSGGGKWDDSTKVTGGVMNWIGGPSGQEHHSHHKGGSGWGSTGPGWSGGGGYSPQSKWGGEGYASGWSYNRPQDAQSWNSKAPPSQWGYSMPRDPISAQWDLMRPGNPKWNQGGSWNQGSGGWSSQGGPGGSWNQGSGSGGAWNQGVGAGGSWNQGGAHAGSWNKGDGSTSSWNQGSSSGNTWNQGGGSGWSNRPPGGSWNQNPPSGPGWSQGSGSSWNQGSSNAGWNQSPPQSWSQSSPHGSSNSGIGPDPGWHQGPTGPGWNSGSKGQGWGSSNGGWSQGSGGGWNQGSSQSSGWNQGGSSQGWNKQPAGWYNPPTGSGWSQRPGSSWNHGQGPSASGYGGSWNQGPHDSGHHGAHDKTEHSKWNYAVPTSPPGPSWTYNEPSHPPWGSGHKADCPPTTHDHGHGEGGTSSRRGYYGDDRGSYPSSSEQDTRRRPAYNGHSGVGADIEYPEPYFRRTNGTTVDLQTVTSSSVSSTSKA